MLAIGCAHLNGFLTTHVSLAQKSSGLEIDCQQKSCQKLLCFDFKKSLKYRKFYTVMINSFRKLLFAAVLRIAANYCFHGSSLLTAVTETHV